MQRQHNRTRRSNWWGVTSKTLDKATALLPAHVNERLPELGIDFALIYPSLGLALNGIAQVRHLRRAAARAYNKMTVDMFAPYAARFAPVAIIPVHTPEEAIAELEYAVGKLGYRAIMLKGNQERPIPSAAEGVDVKKAAWYVDTIALDSPLNYDPFWQRCIDLGVAVTQHSGSRRLAGSLLHQQIHLQPYRPLRRIESRPREGRFPGGVGGAASPESQFRLHGRRCELGLSVVRRHDQHGNKRRPAGLQNPSATSIAELHHFIARYGDTRVKANADAIMNSLDFLRPECSVEELARPEFIADDFAASGIESKEDICGLFSANFYFGCEADDRTTMWAFDPRMGFRLRPVFSSDFTHFDVRDFREVIPKLRNGREGFRHRRGFSRVHLHQCRKAAHAQQSGLLQGYSCRASGGL